MGFIRVLFVIIIPIVSSVPISTGDLAKKFDEKARLALTNAIEELMNGNEQKAEVLLGESNFGHHVKDLVTDYVLDENKENLQAEDEERKELEVAENEDLHNIKLNSNLNLIKDLFSNVNKENGFEKNEEREPSVGNEKELSNEIVQNSDIDPFKDLITSEENTQSEDEGRGEPEVTGKEIKDANFIEFQDMKLSPNFEEGTVNEVKQTPETDDEKYIPPTWKRIMPDMHLLDRLNSEDSKARLSSAIENVRSAVSQLGNALKEGKLNMENVLEIKDLESVVTSFNEHL